MNLYRSLVITVLACVAAASAPSPVELQASQSSPTTGTPAGEPVVGCPVLSRAQDEVAALQEAVTNTPVDGTELLLPVKQEVTEPTVYVDGGIAPGLQVRTDRWYDWALSGYVWPNPLAYSPMPPPMDHLDSAISTIRALRECLVRSRVDRFNMSASLFTDHGLAWLLNPEDRFGAGESLISSLRTADRDAPTLTKWSIVDARDTGDGRIGLVMVEDAETGHKYFGSPGSIWLLAPSGSGWLIDGIIGRQTCGYLGAEGGVGRRVIEI